MKLKALVVLTLSFMLLLPQTISAQSESTKYNAKELKKAIPDEIMGYIPDEFTEIDDVTELAQLTDTDTLLSFIKDSVKGCFKPFSETLLSLLSFIFTASLINVTKNSFKNDHFSEIVSYLSVLSLSLLLYNIFVSVFELTGIFMSSIDLLIKSLLPIMTALYVSGGNLTTAVINNSGISLLITLLNNIYTDLMTPLIKVCFGLTIANAIGRFDGISKIISLLKKMFTFILTASATLLSIFLLFKTNLSAAADGTAVRTIKFAGSFIPVVGGALGESVRSIMSGISLIKNSVGFIGIIIIIFITVPPVLTILMNKLCVDISACFSSLLGCDSEEKILSSFSSLLGFYLALTVCSAIILILVLTVFVMISPALGGA